jgi:hypothetical protein
MITTENITKVVELFQTRQVNLYHACQLQDFEAYLNIGGIPSRKKLEESKRGFTAFTTDEVDRVNGVWDKVFVNLADFGKSFASGYGATPNTYGPILLVINPVALIEAQDVSVTLRSAGARDFNREKESLSSIDEIDRLFAYPIDNASHTTAYVKFKEALQKDFHFVMATNPEINCSFPDETLSLKYVQSVIVDPYNFEGTVLQNMVYHLTKSHGNRCEIKRRYCKCPSRTSLYNEILGIVSGDVPSFQQILSSENATTEMRHWIEQMQGFNLEYQFYRFAKYLSEGTLGPALSMINC